MTEQDRVVGRTRLESITGGPVPASRDPRLAGSMRLGGAPNMANGRPPGPQGGVKPSIGSKGKFKPNLPGVKRAPPVKKEPVNCAANAGPSGKNVNPESWNGLMAKVALKREGLQRAQGPSGRLGPPSANPDVGAPGQGFTNFRPTNGMGGRGPASTSMRDGGGARRYQTISQKEGRAGPSVKLEPGLEGSDVPMADLDSKEEEEEDDLEWAAPQEGGPEWDCAQYYPEVLPLRRPGARRSCDEDSEVPVAASVGYAFDQREAADDTAAQLGLLESGDEGSELMLFQLPSALPAAPLRPPETGRGLPGDDRDDPPFPQLPSLLDLPSGKLGKLLVFRSGAVKLQLGDVLLDVTACGEAGIQQEVVCINSGQGDKAQEGAAIFLGALHHRVVASPDITQLLENAPVPNWRRELLDLPDASERQGLAAAQAPVPLPVPIIKTEPGTYSAIKEDGVNTDMIMDVPDTDMLVPEGGDDLDLSDGE